MPHGRHYALTWGIPDGYAGMTTALLRRSRAFVRFGGASVDILTFDARPDYPELSEELRERGELIDGMRIVNLWDWLRDYHLPVNAPGRLRPGRHAFTPLRFDRALTSRYRGDCELTRTRYADDGTTVLQTDHYRLDGSLMLSDRRDTRKRGVVGGNSVVLCDGQGQPLRSWGGMWAFYRYWLDRLRGGIRSYMVVDSKTVARFMRSYRRREAVVTHLVHGSHLEETTEHHETTRLRESRREVFENLADFDAVVFLTDRQRSDVIEQFGRRFNLEVVPNSCDLGLPPNHDRDPSGGIVLAALTDGKRVDHAALAAIAAAEQCPGITLDVYGEGTARRSIERMLRQHDRERVVRMQGYRADAQEKLRTASFLLLTTRSEGFSLAILESLAAGCIPISYDIPYGPAQLIDHGQNGYLVASGDQAGITRAILELQHLPAERVRALRENARRTAELYSDEAVTQGWSRVFAEALERKRLRPHFGDGTRAVLGAGKRLISV